MDMGNMRVWTWMPGILPNGRLICKPILSVITRQSAPLCPKVC